ncbi:glycosyltransferase family 4 protein [Rhizobium sp. CSW-27]|uniref:glycosyltransferase family 4 protein n=1 Tax=Rhizobium sp. CSW-27 TaxID=2839985 RepID=UPI003390480A
MPETVGGIEQVIHHLAAGAARRGAQVDVLSLSPNPTPDRQEFGGYTVHRCHRDLDLASTGLSLSGLRRFTELSAHADLVHYHFPWPFMDVAHFVTRMKKPAIVTYHSDIVRQKWLYRLYRPLQGAFLHSVDCIVATSPNYVMTSPVLSSIEEKTQVIPIGLDRSHYPEPDEKLLAAWRSRFGCPFYLFIGVLRYYKGLHILLDAARQVSHPIVIVGAGPVERQLKSQAQELGLRNVHFLGHLADADKVCLLKLCYGVVFPSHLRAEAFGLSLLEGAMYGKPIICSEIGTGTSYINIAGETGLVVPPADSGALAQAMRVLWDDPAKAAQMGRRAEERYRLHFTGDRMIEAYMDLYARTVARHAKQPVQAGRLKN